MDRTEIIKRAFEGNPYENSGGMPLIPEELLPDLRTMMHRAYNAGIIAVHNLLVEEEECQKKNP